MMLGDELHIHTANDAAGVLMIMVGCDGRHIMGALEPEAVDHLVDILLTWKLTGEPNSASYVVRRKHL